MKLKKQILFIGNDFGRTGAPLLLLEIAKFFKAQGWECFFFVEAGGILEPEYKKLGKIYLYTLNFNKYRKKLVRFPLKFLWNLCLRSLWRLQIAWRLKSLKADVIYCNTGVSGYLLSSLQPVDSPVVMHIHEMAFILKHHCGLKFTQGIKFVDSFIAVCEESKATLVRDYQIPANKISLIPEFGMIEEWKPTHRQEPSVFKVGCSGYPGWRKGTDLLLQVAQETKKRAGSFDIKFYCVGYNTDDSENISYNFDYQKAELSDILEFVPPTRNPLPIYSQFQLQLLLSREDPNPLVVLEMGALGIPVVCFKGSGRTNEIVKNGGGLEASYLSISEIVDAIFELKNNHKLREACSLKIQSEVRTTFNKSKILLDIKKAVDGISKCA
ncbi:glycosyltransferase [Segetibacter sp. 3557_3]|uniref:glycosyltransferase family 4 protein n=1 Tax=Segetibacter sp. 3557_3 TaxID=2547429 RepID=UPI0010584F9F|nr:glycosyltransferase family 4 protein [Segetibacter sp. 3557_3]TDH20835.1 glycosyltransferase [Segetibacter sp. 3557_3]